MFLRFKCYGFGVVQMEREGFDSEGNTYANTNDMWSQHIGGEKTHKWYNNGVAYWEKVDASVDGVLGGYGYVNDRDVKDSQEFIDSIFKDLNFKERQHLVVLDCGAGVGRVTKNLLLKNFDEVDLVEPVSHFLESFRQHIKELENPKAVGNLFCTSLQDFTPEPGRYDVIWVQWCIGHLTDPDFIAFFNRAKAGLKQGGFFVLKENISKNTAFVLDKDDHSVTRSDDYFCELFRKAGLYVIKSKVQKGFPKELFPVKMYALTTEPQPSLGEVSHRTRSKVATKKI